MSSIQQDRYDQYRMIKEAYNENVFNKGSDVEGSSAEKVAKGIFAQKGGFTPASPASFLHKLQGSTYLPYGDVAQNASFLHNGTNDPDLSHIQKARLAAAIAHLPNALNNLHSAQMGARRAASSTTLSTQNNSDFAQVLQERVALAQENNPQSFFADSDLVVLKV